MSENFELENQSQENLQTGNENLDDNENQTNNQDNDFSNQENKEESKEENKGIKKDADEAGVYGSPENFDYKEIELPDGMKLDDDLLKEFNPLAKKLNLSQSSANELVSLGIKLAQKQAGDLPKVIQQVQQAKVAQYQQALNTDKEIGGGDRAKMNAYLDVADKGYTAFANNEVKQALAEVGLNYHPAIVKMFHRIGELVGDDKIYGTKNPATSQDAADILYGQ